MKYFILCLVILSGCATKTPPSKDAVHNVPSHETVHKVE